MLKINIIILTITFLCLNITLMAQNGIGQMRVNKTTGQNSESFKSFAFNGMWTSNVNSKAVYFEGKFKRTYSCWVDNYGNITVGSFDHETKKIDTHILDKNLEDKNLINPSILIDNDGRLLFFYNKREPKTSSVNPTTCLIRSINPENISQWGKAQYLNLNDKTKNDLKVTKSSFNYVYPIKLKAENDKLYLFWNGLNGKLNFSTSVDNGLTWSEEVFVYELNANNKFSQAQIQIYSNGGSKIHFVISDASSTKIGNKSIYYTYYENGAFFKANDIKIKDIADLPIKTNELGIIYQSTLSDLKPTIWDVAEDNNGNPVIAYSKHAKDDKFYYNYAKWSNNNWINKVLVSTGNRFSLQQVDTKVGVPNYYGGMSIDHENTNELYLSINRDSVFEIEKWTTKNNGKSWKVNLITKGSEKDNIRPFAVRKAEKDNPLQLLWMQSSNKIVATRSFSSNTSWAERFHSSIKMGVQSPKITNPLAPKQILDIMRQTTDWQFANPYDLNRLIDWHWGTFYVGLEDFYELTKEDRYKQEMINIGEHVNYKVDDKFFYADMLTVISNWAWLYELDRKPEIIDHSKWVLDAHLATRRPYKADVRFANNPYFDEWWTWCDALFVAPPVFGKMWQVTGEKKYLDYMDKMFWITTDYLYSKEDSLMYRDDRYFDKRSENGKKIFWGRGNGWVIAGLARILDILPQDYPSRPKYEQMYKEMAAKLLELQGKDHMWRISLLDPEYQDKGETSGSAFYVYALAWGLNNGLLDVKHRVAVENGWKALTTKVNKNGKLGSVQAEGIDPRKFTEDDWQVYGTGAFLMAGKEMYMLEVKK